jgi:hypothetical protein
MPIPRIDQTSFWILQCRQIEREHPASKAARYAKRLRAELEGYLDVLNGIESRDAARPDEPQKNPH